MSSHLINCLSRLHCSYLFISRLRQTPKGAYPNSSDVNNSVSMWVSTNKYNPQNPRLFVCVCFQVKWKTRAHLCDSCGFLFTEQENLVISFKIWANMRVYIGLTNVVSLSFTTLETKKLYACVCVCMFMGGPWLFKPFWHRYVWEMLLSTVLLQSKPYRLQDKYVQCSRAMVNVKSWWLSDRKHSGSAIN